MSFLPRPFEDKSFHIQISIIFFGIKLDLTGEIKISTHIRHVIREGVYLRSPITEYPNEILKSVVASIHGEGRNEGKDGRAL